jgi:hypothetical protein
MHKQMASETQLVALLYDLRWHAGAKTSAELLATLTAFVKLARASTLGALQTAAAAANVTSSSFVRFLKMDDPDIVDVAAVAVTYLSGQGVHTTTFTFGAVTVSIVEFVPYVSAWVVPECRTTFFSFCFQTFVRGW